MQVPTQREIDDVLGRCCDAMDNGSKFPGMTYEEGIEAAIYWMRGNGPNPMDDD